MPRTILGMHAGAADQGVHSVLIDVYEEMGGIKPVFRLGMYQPFPLEICKWLARAGDKPPRESKYFDNACKIIADQFSILAQLTVKEANLKEDSIFAAGCDSSFGAMESSQRFLAFRGWGPGQDVSQATGISMVCINSDHDAVASYPGEALFGLGNEPVVLLHLGGLVKISVFAPKLPSLTFNAGPCASFFELFFNKKAIPVQGVDYLAKLAVQGNSSHVLLSQWNSILAQSMVGSKVRAKIDFGVVLDAIQNTIPADYDSAEMLCTAHHFVVQSIENVMQRIAPEYKAGRIILAGPHARNGFLRHLLSLSLPEKKIELIDSIGIPAPSYDAFSRAVLASYALDGVTVPTGMSRGVSRPLAAFYPGSNASWGKCLRWMDRHSRQAG